MNVIQVENLCKVYRKGAGVVNALHEVTLDVQHSEFLIIKGASGSGKSTLLLMTGGLLRPTSGRVKLAGIDLYAMASRDRDLIRANAVGFIFQMFHLLPYLNVIDNVLLASPSRNKPGILSKAEDLLKRLGLWDRRSHHPNELSVGERQRVAMARALLKDPKIILADEPTGNLDPQNAALAMNALAEFKGAGGTVVVVTHGQDADALADRVVTLKEGRIY